jgi:hypothetical protein
LSTEKAGASLQPGTFHPHTKKDIETASHPEGRAPVFRQYSAN